jgi:hypothetical protein
MIKESKMEDSNANNLAIGPKYSASVEQEKGDAQDDSLSQEYAPPTTSFQVDWMGEPQSSSGSTLGSGL